MARPVVTPGAGGRFEGERCADCDRVLLPVNGGWACRGCGQIGRVLSLEQVAAAFGIEPVESPARRPDPEPEPAETYEQPELQA